MDKNQCIDTCEALKAYRDGKSWEGGKEMVKMEETETEDQRPEVGDPVDKPEAENICVICHDKDKKILNLRSKTCGACYQAWNIGKIDHPTLGKFKPSLTKSKSKTSTIKKPQSGAKATQPGKESPIKSTRRSYPFPDLVTLDFSKYLEIKAVVFERVDKFLLPPEHIIFSMLAGALAGKKED